MDTQEAAGIARGLIREFNLTDQGWRFKYDNAKKRFGQCSYSRKTISLSLPLVSINPVETVRDTILHEIAHAIAGPGAGHGPIWKSVARSIGANPERCYDSTQVNTLLSKWTGKCLTPACGFEANRERLTPQTRDNTACPRCCNGRYDSRYRLMWKQN